MKKRNVVISTLSENVFENAVDQLEDLGAIIMEKRYDLLYHRYEIYARMTLRQSYKMRHFVKSLDATIIDFGS